MAKCVVGKLGDLKNLVGQEIATSNWFEITQERINRFAEATEDRQWIHVYRERAKKRVPLWHHHRARVSDLGSFEPVDEGFA